MRENILAKFLKCPGSRIFRSEYGYHNYTDLGTDYLVLTEEEANAQAKEQVWSFIHTFDPDFLNKHLVMAIPQKKLSELLHRHCDNCLMIFAAFMVDYELFLDEAIAKYGRPYFLCFDDKTEYTVDYYGVRYYVYRLI